ncbi:thermonuclease family protein [Methylorubrum thiocyanatum]|uniref:thermonuclease family protein n=1 Tax=Methylorubrum thiocyanatum TaxID=47958 RepID=UPI0035C85082
MKGSAKAAGRSKDETAAPPEAPVSEDDRRIRALILAELDRRGARPVARRTLALIAEGFVEPADGVPGYRIVDRTGAVRLRGEGVAGVPLTLHDLVEELRAQHAPLFLPPAPEPEPEPARDTIADVRAAGARFVETQSALARSLANSSAERSRALASAASETVEGWRSRLAERLKVRPRPAAAGASLDPAEPAPNAAERLAEARARVGEGWRRVAGGLQPGQTATRLRDRVEDVLAAGSRRPVALMALGAVAGAALVAALSLSGRDAEETGRPAQQIAEAPPQTAPAGSPPAAGPAPAEEAAPDASTDMPPAETERPPEPEPPRKGGNAIVGVPEVIDTATLRVGGKVVRLFGVEWVRGGQADELSKYLRKRTVTCQPAPGSGAHICTVEGRDLSEVVLFNGGGRASSEATPDLVAAEDHARTERLGVWKR